MKSTGLISVVMVGALLASILVPTVLAEARPLLLGNGPNFRPAPTDRFAVSVDVAAIGIMGIGLGVGL